MGVQRPLKAPQSLATGLAQCDGREVDLGSILGSVPREALLAALGLAVAIALIQAVTHASRRWLRSRRAALRMERAVRGEEQAAVRLEALGYAILGAQVVVEHDVRVDDRVVTVSLRADYLAARDGSRYVVEVKTGALAPRIETSATRRQMLEYRIAFDVDGVLLVDGETGRVHEITFPSLERHRPRRSSAWWLFAAAMVAALAAIALVRLA